MSISVRVACLVGLLLGAACQSRPPPSPAPARTCVAPAPAPRPAARPAPGPALEEVLARAGRAGRPALLIFCADWCGWCDKLERETLSRPEVRARLADFEVVEYDPDTARGDRIRRQHGVRGFPALLVLDGSGALLRRIEGFREPAELLQDLAAF